MGANVGEEHPMYERAKISKEIWIEPAPDLYEILLRRLKECRHDRHPDVKTFMVACGSTPGTAKLKRFDNRGHSNSILTPKLQLQIHPEHVVIDEVEVSVQRLDDLLREAEVDLAGYNLLVVDTQGAELETMKGSEEVLKRMDYIVPEVATIELYEGCAILEDVDAWLGARGFTRRQTGWRGPRGIGRSTEPGKMVYGDAIYARREI